MLIKNMDKYFRLDILHRGYNYYKNDNVIEIKKKKGIWYAKVLGRELYNVSIKINKNSYSMRCSCPYAEEDYCKHMAAVLYCLKKNKINNKEDKYIPDRVDDINQFKKIFCKRYFKLLDRKRILNSREWYIYTKLIDSFLVDSNYYIKNNPSLAFKIFKYLMLNVNEIGTDSSKKYLYDNIYSNYKKLFDNNEYYKELIIFIKNLYIEDYIFSERNYLVELLYNDTNNKYKAEEYINLLKELSKKKIYSLNRKELKYKIIVLKYKYISENKALKEAYNNLNNEYICDFLLDIYQDDNDKLVDILERIISKGNAEYIYYIKLLNIYSKYTDNTKFKNLLARYLSKYNSTKTYNLIRTLLYSKEEWLNIRNKYISLITDKDILLDIYISEKLYDDAVILLKEKDIYYVSLYINLYKYNKDILGIYYDKLLEKVDNSTSKDDYKELVDYYDILLKVPNGKKILIKLFDYVKDKYKSRISLIDEISFYEDTYL